MHLAEFLDATGVPQAALPFAQRAVSRLPTGESTLAGGALHASFEYKLAYLEARAGNFSAAKRELENSTRRISEILSKLKTRDPKVDQEFQLLIDERIELSKQLSSEADQ